MEYLKNIFTNYIARLTLAGDLSTWLR